MTARPRLCGIVHSFGSYRAKHDVSDQPRWGADSRNLRLLLRFSDWKRRRNPPVKVLAVIFCSYPLMFVYRTLRHRWTCNDIRTSCWFDTALSNAIVQVSTLPRVLRIGSITLISKQPNKPTITNTKQTNWKLCPRFSSISAKWWTHDFSSDLRVHTFQSFSVCLGGRSQYPKWRKDQTTRTLSWIDVEMWSEFLLYVRFTESNSSSPVDRYRLRVRLVTTQSGGWMKGRSRYWGLFC